MKIISHIDELDIILDGTDYLYPEEWEDTYFKINVEDSS